MIGAAFAVFPGPQIIAPLFLLVSMIAAARSSEGEELRISVASGREFSGYVDARTDNDRLWLRSEGTAIDVVRPINWQRITGAQLGGRQMSVAELRQMVDQLKSSSDLEERRLQSVDEDNVAVRDTGDRSQQTHAEQAQIAAVSASPIRSVDFDAQIANWDGDVEPDGLLIHLFPLDGNGNMTPVSGTLWVEFIARWRGQVGHWSRLIRAADLTTRGVIVKLPFQAIHPSFDDGVDTYGLVHLRLTVPGHGVFEDSYDGVRTRPVFTPSRNALLPSTTGRFFPEERTGRGKRYTRGP
jgi:hypothetical protein